ncbi:MAG: 4Fe-4S binding protein [Clostridia bacterium]|nr:4Fe-4S binding protein [Clostridia bacterium]
MALKAKKLVLNSRWCKGCGVCAEFCPKGVLALEGDKIVIKEIDKCIFCGMCELRCPDYALYLEEVE